MKTVKMIEYAEAAALIQACKAKSEALGVPVSIAVLDGSGNTVMLVRLDNAPFQTPEVARGKALTSVMMRKPSHDVEEATLSRMTLASFHDARLPIQGGLPLFSGEACVGAIAASGGTPVQDEAIAKAGVDAFAG